MSKRAGGDIRQLFEAARAKIPKVVKESEQEVECVTVSIIENDDEIVETDDACPCSTNPEDIHADSDSENECVDTEKRCELGPQGKLYKTKYTV
jgi:hypothetical protein